MSRTTQALGAAAALVAASLVPMPRAHADIHYTQTLTTASKSAAMPVMQGSTPVVHLATYSKGPRQRQETVVQARSFKMETVTLTLCDTGQIIRMDPVLKIYTITAINAHAVAPFGLPSPPRPGMGGMMTSQDDSDRTPSAFGPGTAPGGAAPVGGMPFPSPTGSPSTAAPSEDGGEEKVSASPMITGDGPAPGGTETTAPPPSGASGDESRPATNAASMTGKVVLTYTSQDMGTETLHDLTTHHYAVTIHRQASGCAGNADTTTKMELWFAPVKTGLSCPERSAPQRTITTARGCKITYVLQGDLDAMTQIADQLPVRIKFFDKTGQNQGMMELQDYDQAALDDSLFALPIGYKQVTDAEFTRDQSQNMFRNLMGGAGPLAPSAQGGPGAMTPSAQSGPFPAQPAPGGGGGAFPAPSAPGAGPYPPSTGDDTGTVNQSGDYPAPTQPAPGAAPPN